MRSECPWSEVAWKAGEAWRDGQRSAFEEHPGASNYGRRPLRMTTLQDAGYLFAGGVQYPGLHKDVDKGIMS